MSGELDLESLNEPQREAVLHGDGPLVVFAGAGSGKTRVITYRVAHLVMAREVRPYRILAVTFTNKAAGEMRERLGSLLPRGASELWLGTFHATCARILRKHHEACGVRRDFTVYDDDDQRAMITRILRDFGLDERAVEPKAVQRAINKAKQEVASPSSVGGSEGGTDTLRRVYAAYEERMQASGALDFGDLIYRVVVAMERDEVFAHELRSRWSSVLVDEFQDTNTVQLRLVQGLVAEHRNLTVVGDDDQSIYRWRGANRRNLLDFRAAYPEARIVKLEQNYRSTKRILQVANAVIEQNVDREPKKLWTDNADGGHVVVVRCIDERDEARMVVRAIGELLAAGRRPSDIALLYRIHAQSRVLEEGLRAARIAYRVFGGTRFYDRAEIKDILAYLRLVANPDDDVSMLRVVNVPARGIGKTTIDRVLDHAASRGLGVYAAIAELTAPESLAGAALGNAALTRLGAFKSLVDSLRERASAGAGPATIARAVLLETGYEKVLRDEDNAESDARLENIEELVGSIEEFESEAEEPTLSSFLELAALQTDTDRAAPEDSVTLMTVHAAKGLEFPALFVTGLEERMFPYRGLEPDDDDDELEEERRLAYVAFTRARERLVLSWAPTRRVFGQARIAKRSRFIDEMPREALEEIGASLPPPYSPRPSWSESGGGEFADRPAWRHPQASLASRAQSPSSAGDFRAPGESYYDRSDGDPGDDEAPLRRGMYVRHVKYGVGKVESIAQGQPLKVTVTFPGWGAKQIVATFLEPA